MYVKVKLQDLQTKKIYDGLVVEPFMVGKTSIILMVNDPAFSFYLQSIRGWVMSDSTRLVYVIDCHGKKFKITAT